jgi:hypothetical protein
MTQEFEGPVTIFRGVSGIGLRARAPGLSWTTSRDVACWYAHRYPFLQGAPLVLTAQVDGSELIYYENNRFEQEAIPARIPRALVDPNPSTWVEAMKRYAKVNDELILWENSVKGFHAA